MNIHLASLGRIGFWTHSLLYIHMVEASAIESWWNAALPFFLSWLLAEQVLCTHKISCLSLSSVTPVPLLEWLELCPFLLSTKIHLFITIKYNNFATKSFVFWNGAVVLISVKFLTGELASQLYVCGFTNCYNCFSWDKGSPGQKLGWFIHVSVIRSYRSISCSCATTPISICFRVYKSPLKICLVISARGW